MKKQGLETWLYSSLGVLAMLAVLVGINLIGNRVKVRVDLTAERAYTLSPGTRAILAKLDTPVRVRLYCSQSERNMPVAVKAYAQRVEDLLGEFQQASKGLVEVQKLDPAPDSDAEDSARMDGIEPQATSRGDRYYIGASVTMLEQKQALPVLSPARERQLEYDFARAIARVANPTRPVVGIMSSLPWAGMNNPMMAKMGRPPQREWFFCSMLRRDFELRNVDMSVEKIPEDIKVLLVIHPQGITDLGQYAIDQFVLRGGKLIAFLDPAAVFDTSGGGATSSFSSSSLDKLLKAWGLSFDTTRVVADKNFAYLVDEDADVRDPMTPELTEQAMDKGDILTGNLRNIILPVAGAFSGTPVDGLKATYLLKSSTNAQLMDPMLAQVGPETILKSLKPSGEEYHFAVKLAGKFKTAFPGGKPKVEPAPAEPKPDPKKPEPAPEPSLAESKTETTVLLIGDSDMVQDRIAAWLVRTGDGRVAPRCNNLAFAQSAVDQMAGDENLITARGRDSGDRPFTVVKNIQAQAEEKYRATIEGLEKNQKDTLAELDSLLNANPTERGKRAMASPEAQLKIVALRKKEAEGNKQIKDVRKQLSADIDALKTRTTLLNLIVMPCFVIVLGVTLAIVRRQKQAAR